MTVKATITGLAVGPEGADKPLHREKRAALKLVADKGVEGDKNFGKSATRHVNLVNARSYAWFATSFGRTLQSPGAFGEQIVVSDAIDLNWLPLGAKFKVGTAVLEHVTNRTPCESLREAIQADKVSHFVGHVGILCRVIESGDVRDGDAVQLL